MTNPSIPYPYAYTGEPFFSVAELGAALQLTLDPNDPTALLLQTLASDAVREDLRLSVDFTENDTVVMDGDGDDLLFLPERPVTAVSSVMIAGQPVPQFDWRPNGQLKRVVYPGSFYAGERTWYWPVDVPVTVVYSHGFQVVPTVFKRIALELAAASYSNPDRNAVSSVGRTRTEPAWVGLTLTPQQSSALDLYRRIDA